MSRFSIEIKLKDFSAAHRIINNYNGICRNLHGHNYMAIINIESDKLDSTGFVVDFADIKKIINTWIAENIDHCVILTKDDVALYDFVKQNNQKYYLMDNVENTSAENIAMHLFNKFSYLITDLPNIILQSVKVYESVNSSASYYRS